ncbi:lipid-A-disaccharide synthase [Virgifigura deserti]|uniref:lipid-A-disaccharide synthase n=1 Tax=Virgifigura deserti TaxID=2268457 RepID=UPI003CCB784A
MTSIDGPVGAPKSPDGLSGDPLLFLIAGEPSGDLLGARLMGAMTARTGGRVRYAGVGGDLMKAEGLHSQFPMSELALMGLVEVLPHLPRLLRRIDQIATTIRRMRPDAVVTIDAPAFNFRVAAKLRGSGIPVVHYVAPSVWAWRPDRARKVARFLDHLLALLPFEPPYFEAHGLGCTYIGHPVLETLTEPPDGQAFRRRHDLPPSAPLLCVLPGSRPGEVSRLLPVFGQTLAVLADRQPGLHAVVPTVPSVAAEVEAAARGWAVPASVVSGQDQKLGAFAAADAALAASGTVVLELAAAGLPTIAAYRANPVTAMMLRRLVKVRYATLVNLILDRPVVPEFLQERCTADHLVPAVEQLLSSGAARDAQRSGFQEALEELAVQGRPSDLAAAVVLDLAARSKPVVTGS